MPESRDRLTRPVDIAAIFAERRASIVNMDIFLDESEAGSGSGSITGRGTTTFARRRVAGGSGRGSFRSPRLYRGRNFSNSPVVGQENSSSGGRGSHLRRRGGTSGSVLPSWYPRTPLRDITSIVRAIERRRLRLREAEASNESPLPVAQNAPIRDTEGSNDTPLQVAQNAPAPSLPVVSGVHLEQHNNNSCLVTPNPVGAVKKYNNNHLFSTGKIPMILVDSRFDANSDAASFITPQKKLMNSIDTVGKAMMEELEKQKKTPTAKRAERAKKIRTLMSMR